MFIILHFFSISSGILSGCSISPDSTKKLRLQRSSATQEADRNSADRKHGSIFGGWAEFPNHLQDSWMNSILFVKSQKQTELDIQNI